MESNSNDQNQNIREDEEEIPKESEDFEDEQAGLMENSSNFEQYPVLRLETPPQRLYHFFHQFRTSTLHNCKNPIYNHNNFLKGVKWSPDGSCFLACSDDNTLHLFDACWLESNAYLEYNQDSYRANLKVNEAETIYDYCWYPYMSSSDAATCVFASTTRDHPIHLWDAYTGQLRCTYRAYDAMDEITAALSISFNCLGTKIYAGYNKFLRIFDVHRPGRDFVQHSLVKGNDGPTGLVSSISFSPAHNGMLAIGTYSQTTAVYAEGNMELLYVLHGQLGGVTQVMFSKDGNFIYTGGRKDPYILCWDIRNTGDVLYKMYRSSENTNQRIAFDIEPCGRHLGTGGEDGMVHIYDLQTGQWTLGFQAALDTVNGFSFHPSLPLAVSSSGQRRFCLPDAEEEDTSLTAEENCASVWDFSGPVNAAD